MKKIVIAVTTLLTLFLLSTPVMAGTVYFDGANFFCPSNISGVTCCTKKTYDATQIVGATHAKTVMECSLGESFFLRIPYPSDATNNYFGGRIHSGPTVAPDGDGCFDTVGTVLSWTTGADAAFLNTFGTADANIGKNQISYTGGGAYYETRSCAACGTDNRFVLTTKLNINCNNFDADCVGGWVTVKFTRTNSGVAGNCTTGQDTQTGDVFVSDGYFDY